MHVCYHLTVPPSSWAACDAVVQEATALQVRFGGVINHLYPGRKPGTRFPRFFWGLPRLLRLRHLERQVTVHHIYNPDPYPFAILPWLRRPVVYTISAGVQAGDRQNAQRLARRVQVLVVATEIDRERLNAWGIDNVVVVSPGMDLARFSSASLPSELPPTLLMGSAPWTREQFHTKGVKALLAMAQSWPDLHLVFLWRGILYQEMMQRVRTLGLDDRVDVINWQVDVNTVLARVHAAVALATGDAIIKAYPHSLLEALAAGRPVIVGARIPLGMDVQMASAGVLLETLTVPALTHAFQTILNDYDGFAQRAAALGATFSLPHFLEQYADVYQRVEKGFGG